MQLMLEWCLVSGGTDTVIAFLPLEVAASGRLFRIGPGPGRQRSTTGRHGLSDSRHPVHVANIMMRPALTAA